MGPDPQRHRTLDRHGSRLSISGRLAGAERSVADVTIHIAESAEVTDADFVGTPRATVRAATGQHPVWIDYQVPAGGHRTSAIRLLELRPGEPVDLVLDLEPSRDLRGRLQVAGGALAVGAKVWVQPCCTADGRLLAVGPPLSAALEANGEFVASRLPSAWVSVWVEAPGLQHDAAADARRCVEVLFEDAAQAPAWAGGLERPVADLRSGDGYLLLHLR